MTFKFRIAIVMLCSVPAAVAAIDTDTTREQIEFFESRVRPVLVSKCLSCHAEKKQESELRLDSRGGVLKGGAGGQVVVVRNAKISRLIHAVRYQDDDLKMPPRGKLANHEIEALTRWVDWGVPWTGAATLRADPDEFENHWAFQPIRKPPVSAPNNQEWSRTAIDRLVLARLEASRIEPSPPGDRRTLIRRAAFDLLGLPPIPKALGNLP